MPLICLSLVIFCFFGVNYFILLFLFDFLGASARRYNISISRFFSSRKRLNQVGYRSEHDIITADCRVSAISFFSSQRHPRLYNTLNPRPIPRASSRLSRLSQQPTTNNKNTLCLPSVVLLNFLPARDLLQRDLCLLFQSKPCLRLSDELDDQPTRNPSWDASLVERFQVNLRGLRRTGDTFSHGYHEYHSRNCTTAF
jgi:hypothetical protein